MTRNTTISAIVAALFCTNVGLAQLDQLDQLNLDNAGRTALENAGGDITSRLTPGAMVRRGIATSRLVVGGVRIDLDITERPKPSPRSAVLVEAINALFDQLNTSLDLFYGLILARGGRSPLASIVSGSNDDGNTGDADTTSASDDDLSSLIDGLDLPDEVLSLIDSLGIR